MFRAELYNMQWLYCLSNFLFSLEVITVPFCICWVFRIPVTDMPSKPLWRYECSLFPHIFSVSSSWARTSLLSDHPSLAFRSGPCCPPGAPLRHLPGVSPHSFPWLSHSLWPGHPLPSFTLVLGQHLLWLLAEEGSTGGEFLKLICLAFWLILWQLQNFRSESIFL